MHNDIFVSTGRETAANAYALSPEMAAAYDAGRASERQRIFELLSDAECRRIAGLLDGPQ